MSQPSFENLFREVEIVKEKLQEINFENQVDANEIYETLETHSDRKDRVTFVVSLILSKFGVDNQFKNENGPVITVDGVRVTNGIHDSLQTSEVHDCSNIQKVEDDSQKTTQEYELDSQATEEYEESESQIETQNHEVDNGVILLVESDRFVNRSSAQISTAGSSVQASTAGTSVHAASPGSSAQDCSTAISSAQDCPTAISLAQDSAISLTQASVASCSTVQPSTLQKAEPVSSSSGLATAFHPPKSSQSFSNDLNNNDPNNNTMYAQNYDKDLEKEMEKSRDSEPDSYDFEDISFNQEIIRQTLLEDTRTVHSIFPHHSFEQIYAYLEANTDNPDRIHVVTQIFLNMETNKNTEKNDRVVNEDAVSSVREETVKTVHEETVKTVHEETIKTVREETIKAGSSKVTEKIKGNKRSQASDNATIVIDLEHEEGTLKRQSPPVHEVPIKKSKKSRKDIKEVPTVVILDDDSVSEEIEMTMNNSGEPSRGKQSEIIEVFNSIKEMFPAVDRAYLRSICSAYVTGDFISKVNDIATFLLERPNLPKNSDFSVKSDIRVKSVEELSQKANGTAVNLVKEVKQNPDEPEDHMEVVDPTEMQDDAIEDEATRKDDALEERYQYLLAIFPGADPTYLRNKCEEIGDNEDRMREFISHSLELKDYPTYESYCKRQKDSDMYKKFTENFSVENFLELFPDPVAYFENNGKTEDSARASTYLKNKFRHLRASDINTVFNKKKQNLARTCRALAKYKSRMKAMRSAVKENTVWDNCKISFVQEVAFVENREKIEEYLKQKQKTRDAEFAKAKANGELLECSCCYGDEFLFEDMASCNDGHLFCKDCVRRGAETAIGEGKVTFACLTDCESEFSLKTLQAVLKPSVFSNMLQRKQLEEIRAAGIDGLESCPYCNFATIPPEGDKLFHCLNPECMKETCRNCKEPNHIPLRCDEVEKSEEVRVRTMIEDRMTQALIRTCWSCKKTFVKEDGCNKMTCTCGAKMCYICRQPVKDYSHFNGQGGSEFQKCPLYSTNNELHVEAVKKAAKQAKDEVLAQNPSVALKNDPTKVLPKSDPNQRPLPGIFHNNLNGGARRRYLLLLRRTRQHLWEQRRQFFRIRPIPYIYLQRGVRAEDHAGGRNGNARGHNCAARLAAVQRVDHIAERVHHIRDRLAEINRRRNHLPMPHQAHVGNQDRVDAPVGIMINVFPHRHDCPQNPQNVQDPQPFNEIFDEFPHVQHNIRMVDNFLPMPNNNIADNNIDPLQPNNRMDNNIDPLQPNNMMGNNIDPLQPNNVMDNNIDPVQPNNMMDNNFIPMQHNNFMDNFEPFQPNNVLGDNFEPVEPNVILPQAPPPLALQRPFAPIPHPVPAAPIVEQEVGPQNHGMFEAFRPARNCMCLYHNHQAQCFAHNVAPGQQNFHRCGMPNMVHNHEVQAQNVAFDEARAPVDLTYRPEDLTFRPHFRPGRLVFQNAPAQRQPAQAVGHAPAAGPPRRHDALRQAIQLAMTANNHDRQGHPYGTVNNQGGTRIVLEVAPGTTRQQEGQRNLNFPHEDLPRTMFLDDSDDDDFDGRPR